MTENEVPERFRDEDGDVQMGGREDALIDEEELERKWFKVDGKVYWFDFKEISWEKKTQLLDDSLKTDSRTGEVELDLKGFYRNMMEEVIVDMSVEGTSIPIFLKGMKPELGDKLQDAVPQPGSMLDEDEEGNLETL